MDYHASTAPRPNGHRVAKFLLQFHCSLHTYDIIGADFSLLWFIGGCRRGTLVRRATLNHNHHEPALLSLVFKLVSISTEGPIDPTVWTTLNVLICIQISSPISTEGQLRVAFLSSYSHREPLTSWRQDQKPFARKWKPLPKSISTNSCWWFG